MKVTGRSSTRNGTEDIILEGTGGGGGEEKGEEE